MHKKCDHSGLYCWPILVKKNLGAPKTEKSTLSILPYRIYGIIANVSAYKFEHSRLRFEKEIGGYIVIVLECLYLDDIYENLL